MQTRITSIGKRIRLKLSMSIRPVVGRRSLPDRITGGLLMRQHPAARLGGQTVDSLVFAVAHEQAQADLDMLLDAGRVAGRLSG